MVERVGLFAGTAAYYTEFRSRYPAELLQRLAETAGLDGSGRLLDLGSGPGFLAVPLSAYVDEVVAVDPEPEMLAEIDAPRVRTVVGRAEDVDESWGGFRLATIGRAFHWMDGPIVLERLARVTPQLALLGDRLEETDAQVSVRDVAEELFGERPAMKQPNVDYEESLAGSAFRDVVELRVTVERTWTVEQLIGLAYSTSYGAPHRVAGRRDEFERVLRERLRPVRERVTAYAVLGRISGAR
jgi:SAM-dependent methyltransferase